MKNDQDQFNILRKLNKNMSQRELATDLGFSLGKLNYLINELKNRLCLHFDARGDFKKN